MIFWLVVKKFFFDELYVKYEFFELALRYAEENPGDEFRIEITTDFLGGYNHLIENKFVVKYSRPTGGFGFFSALLLPLFIEYFWRVKGRRDPLSLNGKIVCEVDGRQTLAMFSSLFDSLPSERVVFVSEQRNIGTVSGGVNVFALGLRKDGVSYLRRVVWPYLVRSFSYFSEIGLFGNRIFRIFYIVMLGRAEALDGSNNKYFTYEHLITQKSVRNEFLKRSGTKSIFVPLNSYVTHQYFHSEIFINYDVMCSAGPHTEALYRKKRALTTKYLPTGSYESHRRIVREAGRKERIEILKCFCAGKVSVTIISPGICDPTYRHEVKLMELARYLSGLSNVRVTIRLKPVPPPPKYENFYENHTAGYDRIRLTSGEYDLFDFLETTDLFITTISNGAFDLAQAGAQVMFLDYLNDSELMLCWADTEGVLVPEKFA